MSALVLKLIACITMLIDHIGYMTGFMPFRIIGRIAFPIFLYLICNGYHHTSSKWKYAFRLALFALISQIPFSLFCNNRIWIANGNVFVTLFLSLLCIWSVDVMMKNRILKWFSFLPTLAIFVLYHFGVIQSDYGARGILMALVFFLFDGRKFLNRLAMLFGMIVANFYAPLLSFVMAFLLGEENLVPNISYWTVMQLFAAVAMVFIFAYNGDKGKMPVNAKLAKFVQYGFYLFYPVHQIILWAIRVTF